MDPDELGTGGWVDPLAFWNTPFLLPDINWEDIHDFVGEELDD
jgi:hypothetical protein